MAEHGYWQLNGSTPQLYQRYLVPAITSLWSADLLDRAQPVSGETALDIACGTGVVARMVAESMTLGRVVELDFNHGMLTVARSVPSKGASIVWVEGTALTAVFGRSESGIPKETWMSESTDIDSPFRGLGI